MERGRRDRSAKRKDQGTWRLIKREAEVLNLLREVRGTPDLSKAGSFDDGAPYFLLKPARKLRTADPNDGEREGEGAGGRGREGRRKAVQLHYRGSREREREVNSTQSSYVARLTLSVQVQDRQQLERE